MAMHPDRLLIDRSHQGSRSERKSGDTYDRTQVTQQQKNHTMIDCVDHIIHSEALNRALYIICKEVCWLVEVRTNV